MKTVLTSKVSPFTKVARQLDQIRCDWLWNDLICMIGRLTTSAAVRASWRLERSGRISSQPVGAGLVVTWLAGESIITT